ncbi:hypothetical protein NM688_g7249 [Phlebia brevispora]|uniref:Uncharacterized protein n=1 Tax=Phlebia brevispora TaxID=194682 RepID=A0ACC1S7C3_9APHY|nr:hypothetical protein NM688_g7249 [Phlebia brevispora]
MFKFNFDLDDLEDVDPLGAPGQAVNEPQVSSTLESSASSVESKHFTEHRLSDLIAKLPPEISYSPLTIVSAHGDKTEITISRRDLFDARFQLIASSSSDNPAGADTTSLTDLEYVEAPSDLVPGVYEGGLKTWECSIDLAATLHNMLPPMITKSQRILEIGCGTAVPSVYILHRLFSSPPVQGRRTAIHLQDYNELVFRLVTLPNIILVWYMSPASESFRTSLEAKFDSKPPSAPSDEPSAVSEADEADEPDTFPPADPTESGDLPLPPALLTAFQKSLVEYGIDLRFFSGSWETFDLSACSHSGDDSDEGGDCRYNVVITSETIYQTDSLPALLDLMWRACTNHGRDEGQEQSLEEVTREKLKIDWDTAEGNSYLCLVAAKQVYFGVGGGVAEFVHAIETGVPSTHKRHKGQVKPVWAMNEGVKRSVMRVTWQ